MVKTLIEFQTSAYCIALVIRYNLHPLPYFFTGRKGLTYSITPVLTSHLYSVCLSAGGDTTGMINTRGGCLSCSVYHISDPKKMHTSTHPDHRFTTPMMMIFLLRHNTRCAGEFEKQNHVCTCDVPALRTASFCSVVLISKRSTPNAPRGGSEI